jgi:hypothetical protein
VTYEELLELASAAKGRELETVTGKRFTVGVYRDGPFFTPASSGYGQADGRRAMERFIERYNETGSLRPGDYAEVTRNASYFIGLLLAADEIRSEATSRRRESPPPPRS